MDKIKLIYYKGYNFGDVLSRYVVEGVSGLPVQDKNIYVPSLWWQLKTALKCLIHRNAEFFRYVVFFYERPLMAVGSILSKGNAHTSVWGSGFMNRTEMYRGGYIYALRGKHSNEMLKAQGFKGCDTFGDPAYLLPLLHQPRQRKKRWKVAIIPHFTEYGYFKEKYGDRYHVVNLGNTHVEEVADEIALSELVLSTSLHGIIVAHAYGVKALWMKKGYIETDGVKFLDYFSGVDIPEYDGFECTDELLANEDTIAHLFAENARLALPTRSVADVQRGLLKAAPFTIRKHLLNHVIIT